MAKDPGKSTALVPVGQRKPPTKRKATMPAVVPATTDILRRCLAPTTPSPSWSAPGAKSGARKASCSLPAAAMPPARASCPPKRFTTTARTAATATARASARPTKSAGATRRPATIVSCYVGVPPDHPLWGWESNAVPPDLGIDVHGGLTYSRLCQHGPSPTPRLVVEAARICHVRIVPPPRFEPLRQETDHRVEHADAWWLGFSCDHVYDLVPADARGQARFLQAEVGAVYRDDGYVVRETIALATQLRAIADGGVAPPRVGPPPPPIGLDPRRGGGRD